MIWMLIISTLVGVFISNNKDNQLFKIGPNSGLFIMGVCIDSQSKYLTVVTFCFVNSGFRCMNHNILQSWLINTVQNKAVVNVDAKQSYEISFISTVFNWFDFFMYMNILMSQVDMLIVEIISDLIMTTILTTHYLRMKKNYSTRGVNDETTPLVINH
jgi:hypothetical protein